MQDQIKQREPARTAELIQAPQRLVRQQERVRSLERDQALQREIAEARVREAAERLRRAEGRLSGEEPAPPGGGELRRELEALRGEVRELRRAVERQGKDRGR